MTPHDDEVTHVMACEVGIFASTSTDWCGARTTACAAQRREASWYIVARGGNNTHVPLEPRRQHTDEPARRSVAPAHHNISSRCSPCFHLAPTLQPLRGVFDAIDLPP